MLGRVWEEAALVGAPDANMQLLLPSEETKPQSNRTDWLHMFLEHVVIKQKAKLWQVEEQGPMRECADRMCVLTLEATQITSAKWIQPNSYIREVKHSPLHGYHSESDPKEQYQHFFH